MKNVRTQVVRTLTLLLFIGNWLVGHTQATIRVRVVSVQVLNNVDCDGFFTGNSDFVWEFTATDNTLGFTNNNPALFGVLGFNYAYQNGNNGPYTLTAGVNGNFVPTNGLFFDYQYLCATDVPTVMNLAWEAYENDDAGNYDLLGLTDGETGLQNVTMPVPATAGILNYTFQATGASGCAQNYVINLSVERIPLVVNYFEDAICDATAAVLNTTYTLGWCDYSLEPNEPAAADVQNGGSTWVKFVAPASGSVQITTDLAGTDIGTYFEIYHAADGGACTSGIQPITNTLVKDKFEYLSHIEFSDGIDFLGVDPEAEITLNSCDPIAGISYQKLIPGQTYYVQITADNPNDRGYYEFRVNSLGGSAPDLIDIPCLSNTVTPGTNAISSSSGSTPTTNLGFGCAYDGGNNFGETGSPHTTANPNDYHAYDYDHPAVNNNEMNESVWLNFVAPNNGRMVFETDYESAIYSESAALFGFDARFSPGIPTDYSCANLEDLYAVDGALNGIFGGSVQSAIVDARCLEPGYKYYGMVDPASNLTALSAQNIDAWLYDPSVIDPTTNPPGNDILCLAFANSLYSIPVTLAGTNPNFQAVAGSNEFACREYLAGEPAVTSLAADRADQTVWHYFIAPPSGAVEINLRAYIGMDTLRYAFYELLNGTDCYGGLNPATFTNDGTRNTPVITPLLTGSAGFDGTQESLCCLVPGKIYAVQLDGGAPGDEGQYIIEYIKEVASDAGDVFVELVNGTVVSVLQPDTAFVCFGDTLIPGILLNGIGQSTLNIPDCLQAGFVMHSSNPVPSPVFNSGFTYIDSVETVNGVFVNNTNGTGTFSNPSFNQVYYISPLADQPADWGSITCSSSSLANGVPVVFLQPIVPVSTYNNSTCTISFTSSGGMATYNGSLFNYTIANASGNLVDVGSFSAGTNVVFQVPSAELYTITVTDGSCPYSFTVNAAACANPCITSPILSFVNTSICAGQTIFLEGANQSTAGLYTDVFTAANGCDSTIYTTLSILPVSSSAQTFTICQGTSITVGSSTYASSGIYSDVFTAANGCDSTVTTTLFVESTLTSNFSASICQGDSYAFGGNTLSTAGTYTTTVPAAGGCDSVITLFLTVIPPIQTIQNVTICLGQSYVFNGQNLTTAGSYQQVLTAANGCDSITTLNLTVAPIINATQSATICQGQNYTLGSQQLSTSGTYSELFTNSAGCDSLVTLYLFIDDASEYTQDTTICKGELVAFGNTTITTSGIYTNVFSTSTGCDSIVRLEVSVNDCSLPFEISNILTPNDDGQNDTWKISDYTQISGCNVMIYNRWGQAVYETTDYQNEWGGTKDGELLPDGVYYYSITCDEQEYKGVVNLFRFKK